MINLYLLQVSLHEIITLPSVYQSSKLCLKFLLKYLQIGLRPLDFQATGHLVLWLGVSRCHIRCLETEKVLEPSLIGS